MAGYNYYSGLITFVLATVFSRPSFGQATYAPDEGLLTVDYIIIGVTSAAAAFCLALVFYVLIKNRMKKKSESKIFAENGDKHSMVSSKSSKSSSSRGAENRGFDSGVDNAAAQKLNSI